MVQKLDATIAMTGDLTDAAMGARARAVRIAVGYSQQQIADRLGVGVGAVKAWESRAKPNGVRAKHVAQISDLAGIRSDFIISGNISETVIRRELWMQVRAILVESGSAAAL